MAPPFFFVLPWWAPLFPLAEPNIWFNTVWLELSLIELCSIWIQVFAELNPICQLLALLAHHILRVSRIRVNRTFLSAGRSQLLRLAQPILWFWYGVTRTLLDWIVFYLDTILCLPPWCVIYRRTRYAYGNDKGKLRHHAKKTYGEVRIQLHVFLNLVLEGVEWLSSRSGRFTPAKSSLHSWLDWHQSWVPSNPSFWSHVKYFAWGILTPPPPFW